MHRSRDQLILDEIQTGLGRTGRMLAEEHEGIEADVTLIGKALSGGFYPVSAVLSDDAVLGVLKPGEHGSTFGGNPLGAAVARMALRVLVEEGMIENSAKLGAYFLEELKGIKSDMVREVRGRGLMLAIEFKPDGAQGQVDRVRAQGSGGAHQGHPRDHHPHHPATGHHPRRDRLGTRAVRCRPDVRQPLVGEAFDTRGQRPSAPRSPTGGEFRVRATARG